MIASSGVRTNSAPAARAAVSADDQFAVAPQIPDSGVNLSKTNLHAALGQIMRNDATGNCLFWELMGLPDYLA